MLRLGAEKLRVGAREGLLVAGALLWLLRLGALKLRLDELLLLLRLGAL